MSLTTNEYPELFEADVGEDVWAVTFSADGKHLIAGCGKSVRVWGAKDGQQVAAMSVGWRAYTVAVSRDGRYVAAGLRNGQVIVWDARKTYERIGESASGLEIQDIDFSPDSSRLVFAQWLHRAVTVLDNPTCKKVQTFDHGERVFAVTYSPQGDRVATASGYSVRVWDSNDGQLLLNVGVGVVHRGLLWRHDHLFVATEDRKIKQINASTGSTASEWQVPDTDSCIALPQNGKTIAYSVKRTISFVDMLGNTQPTPIQHTDDARSLTCSSDGRLLAIATGCKITVKDSSRVLFRSISEPQLDIDNPALNAWKHGQLTDAEALLSAATQTLGSSTHHVLASRALVRARLGHWDSALADAKQSIRIKRSVIGYIAMCVTLVGKGEIDEGFRACDIASLLFPSDHVSLLLIKAIVLFMAGKHVDAITRLDDLITDAGVDPKLYVVQAYMHLLLGDEYIESCDYERALQSFENARFKLGDRTCRPPLVVTLISGWGFDDLTIIIQQRLCEVLLTVGRTKEAGKCLLRTMDQSTNMTEPFKECISHLKYRCCGRLEVLGDSAVNAKQYDEAVSHYTVALSLVSTNPQDLLVKRSKAYAEQGEWKNALNDANELIKLNPRSPSGYETKYTALVGLGHHDNAVDAFEAMLSKMSVSSDPDTLGRFHLCVQTKEAISKAIENAIRDSPLVLINTLSGRLCDKSEQTDAFKSTPAFTKLIMSMTTHIDLSLIEKVVGEFYRYTTFSHTWQGKEPLYEKVTKTVVYDLEEFSTHSKLQMFCRTVRDEGFNWAWSDTCCINKGDPFVLQEALVSMFKWYEGSALTIIFLCDVDQLAEVGALIMSLWNSRGWTLQEYHASKVVRIYTKDWTPYLGLTIYNHKESTEIISEMEKATGISAQSLMALRPGLSDIREKLRLASTRQTTRVEDAAYSLLGIFSITLPVTYGEGDKALGRLLSQLLMSSGDTSILAWTGESGSFNSCLPENIVVFRQPLTLHIPPAVPEVEMESITAELHALSLDPDLVTMLFDRVSELPTPTFAGQRMRLPCLAFEVRAVKPFRKGSGMVFRAQASGLGTVEIKTRQNIVEADSLYLIHPWIDFLLDRHAVGSITEIAPHMDNTTELGESPSFDPLLDLSCTSDTDPLDDAELLPPSTVPLTDAQVEFLARLRRPFGALLLAPTRQNVAEYRRIATESVITVRVEEITSATLNRSIRGVRVLDVL